MSWTKREFVRQAFEEIGYASYDYDLEPEQLQAGLRRLDSMMATWSADQIFLGYPLPGSPGSSDLDEVTQVPDRSNQAIYLNLAISLCQMVGKQVPPDLRQTATEAYNTVLGWAVHPREMKLPRTMPAGAGNKPWRTDQPFIRPCPDNVITGPEDDVEFTP